EALPDWLNRDITVAEVESIVNIQKVARGTSGASRNSARAGNAPGGGGTAAATTATATAGKKGAGGKDKNVDDKAASKQQSQLNASLSTAELQGKLFAN
ncbi:unnamed protein product, partial [Rotaria socialis]